MPLTFGCDCVAPKCCTDIHLLAKKNTEIWLMVMKFDIQAPPPTTKINNVCSACSKTSFCHVPSALYSGTYSILLAPFPGVQQAHFMAIALRLSLPSSVQMISPCTSPPYKQVCITLVNFMLPSTHPSPSPLSCFRPYVELSHLFNPLPDAKGHLVHLDGMQRAVTKHAVHPCMNRRAEHEKGCN